MENKELSSRLVECITPKAMFTLNLSILMCRILWKLLAPEHWQDSELCLFIDNNMIIPIVVIIFSFRFHWLKPLQGIHFQALAQRDIEQEPIDPTKSTWKVHRLTDAGLPDIPLTFVRKDNIDIWNLLSSLSVCSDPDCWTSGSCGKTRGVWICGPPGIGKSTLVFGCALYMATRNDGQRQNMIWIHQTTLDKCFIVLKFINGRGYRATVRTDSWTTLVEECEGCSIILFDGMQEHMQAFILVACDMFPKVCIIACTSYRSGFAYDESSITLSHFNTKRMVYSWSLDEYLRALDCRIFQPYCYNNKEINDNLIRELFYYCGGNMQNMLNLLKKQMTIQEFCRMKQSQIPWAARDRLTLLDGLQDETAMTVNSLISVHANEESSSYKHRYGVVSEYVVKLLSTCVDEKFVVEYARERDRENYWFKLEFLWRLQHSKHEVRLQGDDIYDGTCVIPKPTQCVYYHEEQEGKLSCVHGALYIVCEWNEGCFDAVQYFHLHNNQHTFYFMNINAKGNRQDDGKYNGYYIEKFLQACLGTGSASAAAAGGALDIKVIVIEVTPSTCRYEACHAIRRQRNQVFNIEHVHSFDPSFTGHVFEGQWK